MTRQEFASALRALTSFDANEIIAAGISLTPSDVRRLEADPARFFERCADERAAALWRLMATRTRVGFDDAPLASVVYRHIPQAAE